MSFSSGHNRHACVRISASESHPNKTHNPSQNGAIKLTVWLKIDFLIRLVYAVGKSSAATMSEAPYVIPVVNGGGGRRQEVKCTNRQRNFYTTTGGHGFEVTEIQ